MHIIKCHESELKILSWNVEVLSKSKRANTNFVDFISKYDLICLSESWTSRNSNITLNGYCNPIHSYRRVQNRRAKRNSGGIIIYIKDTIRPGIKLVKNEIDCLVWIMLDKNFFHMENDWYLAITYIPPESSNYHTLYDIDIFSKLEEDLCFYKTKGNIVQRFGNRFRVRVYIWRFTISKFYGPYTPCPTLTTVKRSQHRLLRCFRYKI